MYSMWLRRALSLSSSLINNHRPFSAFSSFPSLSSVSPNRQNPRLDLTQGHQHRYMNRDFHLPFQSRPFRSSTVSLSCRARWYFKDIDDGKIGPDTILDQGCDYNHWLITMDFPKDPKPTLDEMVETYVRTCAAVVGNVEEAKKRIYACSTTAYTGFQVLMTEEISKKFHGLPGVASVLPDSYIHPIRKKRYRGDRYINGKIIPAPLPVQHGRRGERYGAPNRDFTKPAKKPNFISTRELRM